jgi:hypothetical protein
VTANNPYNNSTSTPGPAVLGGTNLYGGTWNTTTGFAGTMVAGGEAYSTLKGLQGPYDKSNSFTNWSAADSSINHITATSFGIYVFEIYATLGANGNVALQFAPGELPLGTYAIAYGWTPANGGKDTQIYDTPFTEAGLTTLTAPEPSTFALAFTGAVGLGLVGLRRLRRQQGGA